MGLIKIRGDGGKKLGGSLCQEAPAERPFIRKEDREKDPNVPKEKAAEATLAQDPQHLAPIAPAAGNAPAVEPAVTEAAAIPSAVEVTK